MKILFVNIIATVLTLSFSVNSQAQTRPVDCPPSKDMKAEIVEIQRKQAEAVQKKDAAEYAQLFTEDATLLFTGVPKVVGRAEIESLYQGFFLYGLVGLTLNGESVESFSKDVAAGIGTYSFSLKSGNKVKTYTGKGSAVYKRVNCKWLIHIDNAIDD